MSRVPCRCPADPPALSAWKDGWDRPDNSQFQGVLLFEHRSEAPPGFYAARLLFSWQLGPLTCRLRVRNAPAPKDKFSVTLVALRSGHMCPPRKTVVGKGIWGADTGTPLQGIVPIGPYQTPARGLKAKGSSANLRVNSRGFRQEAGAKAHNP